MLLFFYYTQWTLILVFRIIDLIQTADIGPWVKDGEDGRNWTLELLPLLSMVTTTWILWSLFKFCRSNRLYVEIERQDLQRLFVTYPTPPSMAASMHLPLENSKEKSSQESCPICLECYSNDISSLNHQRLLKTKVCGHVFHELCIMSWCLHQESSMADLKCNPSLTCPCCRHPLQDSDKKCKTIIPRDTPSSFPMTRNWKDFFCSPFYRGMARRRRRTSPDMNGRDQMMGVALCLGIVVEIIRLILRLCQGVEVSLS